MPSKEKQLMIDLWKDDIPNHSRSTAQYMQYSKQSQIFHETSIWKRMDAKYLKEKAWK